MDSDFLNTLIISYSNVISEVKEIKTNLDQKFNVTNNEILIKLNELDFKIHKVKECFDFYKYKLDNINDCKNTSENQEKISSNSKKRKIQINKNFLSVNKNFIERKKHIKDFKNEINNQNNQEIENLNYNCDFIQEIQEESQIESYSYSEPFIIKSKNYILE
ncbi:hypothetical protein CWI36_0149p0070 [Hamiltosporidium magnivora]|uniref:Uncharacterized protein n=1 Tax=Hamiltosporidium magnivora TaxID=148818 RepID=A0A4Q9LK03_9MICR|nr:hypothetical protein CWI36_0149p0070 [Hamiltosporidium magnivora]